MTILINIEITIICDVIYIEICLNPYLQYDGDPYCYDIVRIKTSITNLWLFNSLNYKEEAGGHEPSKGSMSGVWTENKMVIQIFECIDEHQL